MENFIGKKLKISWFACTKKGARILSLQRLSATDSQLLFYLLNNIDQNNRVRFIDYKTISKKLTYYFEQGLIDELDKENTNEKEFKTDYVEFANKDVQELKIAKEIEESYVSLSSVKKSMKKLRDLNIITRDINYSKTLFINPTYFYAGDFTTNKDKLEYYNTCKIKNQNKKNNKQEEK